MYSSTPSRLSTTWQRVTPKGVFGRNIAKLVGATAVGHILTMAVSPLLARLFDPSDFALLGEFTSTLAMVVIVASLRYEYAIPLPLDERTAANLLVLCVGLLLGGTLFLSGGLWLWGGAFTAFVNKPELGPYLWLLPVSYFSIGAFQILNYWSVRTKSFSALGLSGVVRAGFQAAVQIVWGVLALGPLGLVLGSVAGQLSADGTLAWSDFRKRRGFLKLVSLGEIRHVIWEYRRFPLYTTLSSLCNSAGINLPFLILAGCYGDIVAGSFFFCHRVMGKPMRFAGKAISDVYFAEAAARVRERPESLWRLYCNSTAKLSVVAVPLGIGALAAPWLFETIFGAVWREAGEYCRILSLVFVMQFYTSTSNLTTYGANHWQLGWDVFRLLATTIPLLAGYSFGCTAAVTLMWFALGATLSHSLLIVLNLLAIKRLNGAIKHAG